MEKAQAQAQETGNEFPFTYELAMLSMPKRVAVGAPTT